jgi:xanthine dehydrogenase/oxidase
MSPNGKSSDNIILEFADEERNHLAKGWRTALNIWVNGRKMGPKELVHMSPTTTLLSFLRSNGITGTKLGCAEGGCGACTVIVSKETSDGNVHHKSVNACLFPAVAADCAHVTTVEGLGSTRDGLHPVQERMTKSHGSQCGFCTPGIVVAISAIFANKPDATIDEIEEHMDGNLCRCTGYRPIWDSAKVRSRSEVAL